MRRRPLCHRQRRANIALVPGIERKDLPPQGAWLPPVRRLAPPPMREPVGAFGPQPSAEPPNVPRREP
jgi:hypothetical protein